MHDPCYVGLLFAMWLKDQNQLWDGELLEYRMYRTELTLVDGVMLFRGRVVVLRCYGGMLCTYT